MPDPQPPRKPDEQGSGEGPPPIRFNRNVMGWVIFFGLALLLIVVVYENMHKRREITADEFWAYIENGQVESVVVRDQVIEGELRADIPGQDVNAPRKFRLDYVYSANKEFEKEILKCPEIKYEFKPGGGIWAFLPQLLIWGVIFALIYFLVIRQFRGAGGGPGILGSFGRSRHRVSTKEHAHVTFDDVAGIQEAKEEVKELIEFLRNPKRFQRLGARIPRGVLLVGEPGCGKTLLAKAIAGEADVPFFSISGSDFVEMFVGVGASRVRDLFKQAKDGSPCIIFLDEIDAVGRRRGASFSGGGGHDEREQTLNAILVEMDGFESSDQVIVIAATNRMDVLDPALTRPGRFDRQINVPLPDIVGRVDILKIYADKVTCGPDVDLHRLARGTPMFSGADLAALINEAAIAATMAGKDFIEQSDLEEARDKVRWGRARKSHVVDEHEKKMTAYHEAGHALIQILTPDSDPLHKVSIIPRGIAGGATFSLPEKDRHIYTRQWCRAFINVMIAGRIAQEVFFRDVDSGAAMDIAQATHLARKMVMDWGMSEKLGFVRYTSDPASSPMAELGGKDYSDKTAETIDKEVNAIMTDAETETRKMVEANRDHVQRIAEALLKYETLQADEVQSIMDGKSLDKPTVGDLLAAENAKRDAKDVTQPESEDETEEGPAMGAVPQPG